MFQRHLVLATMLTVAAPTMALAAGPQFGISLQFGSQNWQQNAYREGFERGRRAGEFDGRRGVSLQFEIQSDYRRGDFGYRNQYGDRDRYRNEFRRGFEMGYRQSFTQFGRNDRYGQGPYSDGRYGGYGNGPSGRFDPASQNGFNDGYDAGARDARDRNRFDPISERRYRSADHGYNGRFGSRERYKDIYRDAFRNGYEQGYRQNDRGRGW